MRPRFIASAIAALSAALSASLATATDPLPLPGVGNPPAAVAPLPPIPNAGAQPVAPSFLPTFQEKGVQPKPLPVVPLPRTPGEAPPTIPDVPVPVPVPVPVTGGHAEMPATAMPKDRSIHDDHLGPWNTVWVRGGYNYLWIKDAPSSVPLLATGTGSSTRVLLGGQNNGTNYSGFSGGTFTAGMWLNERHTFGLSLGGFISEKRSTVSSFTSDVAGNPLLIRPFFNSQIGGANAFDGFVVSSPGQFTGSIASERGARVDGFDINLLANVCNTKDWTANLSLGMRYFDLDEYQTVYQVTQSTTGAPTIPFFNRPMMVSGVAITDRFHTRNQFYGTQFGGDFEYRFGPMFLDLGVKAALGPVHQVTEVSGTTVAMDGTGGPGGFLAVGGVPNGNQGRTSTNYFAVLSDVNGTIGVQVSNHLRLGLGYQFLYLNTVARPANQIVSTIDPRLLPTSTSFNGRTTSSTQVGGPGTPPRTPFDRDDFFVHGLRFVFELQY